MDDYGSPKTSAQNAETKSPFSDIEQIIQDELPNLQAEVDYLTVSNVSADEVAREATSPYEQWLPLPAVDKRKVVEALVEKVQIGNSTIDISLSYHWNRAAYHSRRRERTAYAGKCLSRSPRRRRPPSATTAPAYADHCNRT